MKVPAQALLKRACSYTIVRTKFFMILVAGACLFSGTVAAVPKVPVAPKKVDYKFKNKISREVLENYLNRAITMQSLLVGKGNFDDNLRMIKNIGVKFIGRAVCQWGGEAQIPQNLVQEKELAAKIHSVDPDIILQACIFEIVTPSVNQVPVPDWALKALGMPVVARNFNLDSMKYTDAAKGRNWGGGGIVPDVSRPETKLFFYYLGASYLDAGIEGLHFGQVELMNKNDQNLDNYAQVLTMIRDYAHKHGRRGMVICDAHVPHGGFIRNGHLLLDVHAFPMRVEEIPDTPQHAKLEVGHTDALFLRSKGGITPSGWTCEHLPYLVELDNYGSSRTPGQAHAAGSTFWVWGFDEISWFTNQPAAYRQGWLHYAYDWVKKTDPNGHVEMPGGRQVTRVENKKWYYANNKSDTFPDGMGDEDTIRDIWAASEK
ncbi:MAG: hypothetical protein JWQ79_2757 [Mucilaginibacter sp.]|nr:hypothetical protein [Mucilaginibacter sp.]